MAYGHDEVDHHGNPVVKTAPAAHGGETADAYRASSEPAGSLSITRRRGCYLEAVLTQDTEAVRLARLRYTAGATDLLHVLQLRAKQINTRFDLIGIYNQRLANRVGLHLALRGGFEPPPTP
jgi:multidrug efflux system outer membrane protein